MNIELSDELFDRLDQTGYSVRDAVGVLVRAAAVLRADADPTHADHISAGMRWLELMGDCLKDMMVESKERYGEYYSEQAEPVTFSELRGAAQGRRVEMVCGRDEQFGPDFGGALSLSAIGVVIEHDSFDRDTA